MFARIPVTIFFLALMISIGSKSFAGGVANSRHDMYSLGKGTDPNVCSYCHVPHKAAGEKIWSKWGNEARLTSGPSTTIGNMCYTCHDGTATSRGMSTAFNTSLQQHKMSAGEDCDLCHSVHDNANGKFMNVARLDSYCSSCHNNVVNAGGLGDHVNGVNHPDCGLCHGQMELDLLGDNGDNASCHLCHAKAHGAANYSAPGVTNPILKWGNPDSQICGTCHYNKVQAAAGGAMHPANMSATGSYGKLICQSCHDPHQPGVTGHPFLLTGTNQNSQMCINCHDGAQGPDIGHSHPYNVPFGSIVPVDSSTATGTPRGNAINDENYAPDHIWPNEYPDYPGNSPNIICETCHGVHNRVDNPGTKLLRITNTNAQLCNNCHTDK